MTQIQTETPEKGWESPPQPIKGGYHLIASYADVLRAFKDPRFLSVLGQAPNANACPWLRFKQSLGLGKIPQKLLTPHQLQNYLKKSFIYHEHEEYERLHRPIKKLFLGRLPAIQENLQSNAGQILTGVSGQKSLDWVESVIRPYISSGIKTLFDYPDNLEEDFYRWFTLESISSILGEDSAYSRSAYEKFSEVMDFLEKCMDSPDLHKTGGLMLDICRLSEKPASLTREEILGNSLFLLLAAVFSTPRSISASLKTLFKQPDLLRQLQKNPSLIPTAIPEFLRINPPLSMVVRQVGEDILIHNVKLRKGSWIYLDLKSANRDPRIFSSPDKVILERSPNPHLSFGAGTHYCLGVPLARMQIEAFLKAFLKQHLDTPFELCPDHKNDSAMDNLWIRPQAKA